MVKYWCTRLSSGLNYLFLQMNSQYLGLAWGEGPAKSLEPGWESPSEVVLIITLVLLEVTWQQAQFLFSYLVGPPLADNIISIISFFKVCVKKFWTALYRSCHGRMQGGLGIYSSRLCVFLLPFFLFLFLGFGWLVAFLGCFGLLGFCWFLGLFGWFFVVFLLLYVWGFWGRKKHQNL